MKCYKLTNDKGQTRNNTQWGNGVVHRTDGKGPLCGPGWLHFYSNPVLAVLLNPIHADFDPRTMRLWEAEARGKIKTDRGLKAGTTHLITLGEIPVPQLTHEQRVAFAIHCAVSAGYKGEAWTKWARGYLDGTDRTAYAANAAADAAAYAADAAANAAADAAYAANANAAAYAAYAAANAAAANAAAAAEIDFAAIILWLVNGVAEKTTTIDE